jgi:hypothetical protein
VAQKERENDEESNNKGNEIEMSFEFDKAFSIAPGGDLRVFFCVKRIFSNGHLRVQWKRWENLKNSNYCLLCAKITNSLSERNKIIKICNCARYTICISAILHFSFEMMEPLCTEG